MSGRGSRQQIRALRWRLTAGYLLVSGLCLAALVVIASLIDGHARANDTDARLGEIAGALSRAIYYDDDGRLQLEPLEQDSLIYDDDSRVAVLECAGTPCDWTSRYSRSGLPTADLTDVASEAREAGDVVHGAATSTERLAAAPVWDGDDVGAVVVAAIDTRSQDHRHLVLTGWLILGSAGLLVVAGVAGHALSGRSTRVAVDSLDQQERFLADAAHELRTPLARLRAVAENGEPDALPRVSAMTEDIGRVVTALLLRARLDAGNQIVEHDLLRLDLLVEQVVDDERDHAAADIVLTVEPTVVRGDADLLTHAVRNLVTNALQHGGGSPVEVTVTPGRVIVDDAGPGIPVDERRRVFDRHVTGRVGGTGIGLAIVRQVVREHRGSVELSTSPHGGTRAEISLPPSP